MKCLYWNTKNIKTIDQIIDLLNFSKPNFLFLAEIDEQIITDNKKFLSKIDYEHFANPGCSRVLIIKKVDTKCNLNLQTYYYTTVYIPLIETYIISVHIPSQIHNSMDSLKSFLRQMRIEINQSIGESYDQKILVIGDFNANPFESPLINLDGFAATNTTFFRRKVKSFMTSQSLYYNPTWKLYAQNNFPGTTFFQRPSGYSYDILEHHFLDQAILSRKLFKSIKKEEIRLIYLTSNTTFFDIKNNKILLSDHLPLELELTF